VRILLVSDLHYNLRQYDWVMSRAGAHDVVVIAGDHLNIASPVALEAQIAAVRVTLGRLATLAPLLVCSGNHDLDARSPAGEKTTTWLGPLRRSGVAVDGDSATIAGVTFTIVGWWDGPAARDEAELALDRAAASCRRPWVWVYHSPPEGPLSWTGRRHFGDPVVASWIRRWAPDAVLCGHIHQAPFVDGGSWADRVGTTWVFNAGAEIGAVPPAIEIDLGRRRAAWTSVTGRDRVDLDAIGAEIEADPQGGQ